MITKKILFLCTGNSARSQIAEGLIRKKGASQIEAYSAGTSPETLNPMAVQVMNEIGIDISHHKSKDVAGLMMQSFDWVITVCDHARQQCPIFPGTRIQHWDIADPETLSEFRRTREDLSTRIDKFLQEIGVSSAK